MRGVRVFGPALRGDDMAGSDLDLLVEPTAQTTLMDIGAIRFLNSKEAGFDVAAPPEMRDHRIGVCTMTLPVDLLKQSSSIALLHGLRMQI